MEHHRTKEYQFTDSVLYMIVDTLNGEQIRMNTGTDLDTYVEYQTALDYLIRNPFRRYIMVKVDCIRPFKLSME